MKPGAVAWSCPQPPSEAAHVPWSCFPLLDPGAVAGLQTLVVKPLVLCWEASRPMILLSHSCDSGFLSSCLLGMGVT